MISPVFHGVGDHVMQHLSEYLARSVPPLYVPLDVPVYTYTSMPRSLSMFLYTCDIPPKQRILSCQHECNTTYTCVYIYIYIHVHTYVYAYIYIYTHIHTYIHICLYLDTHMHSYNIALHCASGIQRMHDSTVHCVCIVCACCATHHGIIIVLVMMLSQDVITRKESNAFLGSQNAAQFTWS